MIRELTASEKVVGHRIQTQQYEQGRGIVFLCEERSICKDESQIVMPGQLELLFQQKPERPKRHIRLRSWRWGNPWVKPEGTLRLHV